MHFQQSLLPDVCCSWCLNKTLYEALASLVTGKGKLSSQISVLRFHRSSPYFSVLYNRDTLFGVMYRFLAQVSILMCLKAWLRTRIAKCTNHGETKEKKE